VPYLRLRGRWLRDAGFAIGQHKGSLGRTKIRERSFRDLRKIASLELDVPL
jgi:hypothetical protein